jgi:ankyrin repeat protein
MVLALALAAPGVTHADARLAEAVKDRNQAALVALLKQRADVNAPLADGTTAVHWAAQWDDLKTAELLIRAGAKVNAANRYGATPLWAAATNGSGPMVERLLRAGADPNTPALEGEPPLLAAARAGSVEAVTALLAHGANVNATEAWRGQTALMWAVGDDRPQPEVARVLLERGADVNLRSKGGFTPLLFAVRQGDLEATKVLVKAGAAINDPASDPPAAGRPAAAISSVLLMALNNGHMEIANFLLENGADPNTADRTGFTPLHVIVRKRAARGVNPRDDEATMAMAKTLIARGANVNARTPEGGRSRSSADDTVYGPYSAVQTAGVSPFWIAANIFDSELMRVLVANGADPRRSSAENTTPLMAAAGLGYGARGGGTLGRKRGEGTDADVLEALALLVAWGNDVNAVNEHGQTAVHGAIYSGAPAVLQFLADNGARINQKDATGRTPSDVADENKAAKYRSSQELTTVRIESTWALVHKLGGEASGR